VGDAKMSALATRAALRGADQHYLCPLALTGATAEQVAAWITAAATAQVELSAIRLPGADGQEREVGQGYEVPRTCTATVDGQDGALPDHGGGAHRRAAGRGGGPVRLAGLCDGSAGGGVEPERGHRHLPRGMANRAGVSSVEGRPLIAEPAICAARRPGDG